MRYLVVSHLTGRILHIAATVEACEAFIVANDLRGKAYIK